MKKRRGPLTNKIVGIANMWVITCIVIIASLSARYADGFDSKILFFIGGGMVGLIFGVLSAYAILFVLIAIVILYWVLIVIPCAYYKRYSSLKVVARFRNFIYKF